MNSVLRRALAALRDSRRLNAVIRRHLNPGATDGVLEQGDAALMRQFSRLSRNMGIDRLYVVLSFDCDTPEDAAAAARLDPELRTRAIKPIYAVPGTQLRQHPDIYRRLAENGAQFMNHGARPHAERRGSRYYSITDYAQMSPEEVAADIRDGHRTNIEVLGHAPSGFRAPHFGSFQESGQVALIHRIARELGYRYCSTTLPSLGLERGPAIQADGLWEFPLTGSFRAPTVILDSWNYLIDRERLVLSEEYFTLFRETVDFFVSSSLPAVLNYYVDPAHVVENPPFHRVLDYVASRRIPSLSYLELIALIERRDSPQA